jgi:hypothetical protein
MLRRICFGMYMYAYIGVSNRIQVYMNLNVNENLRPCIPTSAWLTQSAHKVVSEAWRHWTVMQIITSSFERHIVRAGLVVQSVKKAAGPRQHCHLTLQVSTRFLFSARHGLIQKWGVTSTIRVLVGLSSQALRLLRRRILNTSVST